MATELPDIAPGTIVTATGWWNPLTHAVNEANANIESTQAAVSAATADISSLNGRASALESAVGTPYVSEKSLDNRVTTLEQGGSGMNVTATKYVVTNERTVNSTTATTLGSTNITVNTANAPVVILANFDVAMTAANTIVTAGGTACLVVKCLIDGTARNEQLIFGSQAVWRGTAGQTWVLTNLRAGGHTVAFTAQLSSAGAVAYQVSASHTGAALLVFG